MSSPYLDQYNAYSGIYSGIYSNYLQPNHNDKKIDDKKVNITKNDENRDDKLKQSLKT